MLCCTFFQLLPEETCLSIISADTWTTQGLWGPTLHTDKNPSIILQSALLTCGSASRESINRGRCRTVVFTLEKNPHISAPTQFKPLFFKGQMYFINSSVGTTCIRITWESLLNIWIRTGPHPRPTKSKRGLKECAFLTPPPPTAHSTGDF